MPPVWEFTLDRWICKLDVLGGVIMSWVQYRALSWVSGTCFKMATLENLVSILCKNPNLQTKLAKCGFVHALEKFLDSWLKVGVRGQVMVFIE